MDLTTSPPTLTDIFTGGSRGDFVAVGFDGCLYATQTDSVVKVTNTDGSCLPPPLGPLLPTSVIVSTNKCPLTQGFRKNHPDAWPVTSLTLGSQTYTKTQLLTILNLPSRGDASLTPGHNLSTDT